MARNGPFRTVALRREPVDVTIGKARGLQQVSNDLAIFTITALDHRGSLKRALAKATPDRSIGFNEVVQEKIRLTRALAPFSTAVLLDPVYGAGPCIAAGAIPPGCGLLIALEESGYDETEAGRFTKLTPEWSVEKIKRTGAAAVKVLLFYHPANEAAAHQEAFVSEVAKACAELDIAFFLEPMSYPFEPGVSKSDPMFAATKHEVVLETVRRLGPLGADVLKLEFPDEPAHETDESRMREHVRALSEASPVPWVLLSEGKDYPTFQRQVEIACQEGASGFLGGRAIWQEAMTLARPADRDGFLARVAVPRLRILTAIAEAYATPWTDKFPSPALHASAEGWHEVY
jgi:tagatose 1,6-diphosphate aldolase